jgi:hypothetical protein
MLHWYFMLIVMGTPIQFGPFTEEKCTTVSEKMFSAFDYEIQVGKILKVECWRVVGA